MSWALETVTEEATRRGLSVERASLAHPKPNVAGKLLLIAGKRCQVVPTHFFQPDPHYPEAVCMQIYLPRTEWADFIIYAARSAREEVSPSFYIVPRWRLNKDTCSAPTVGWIKKYEDAWHVLTDTKDSLPGDRRFQVLSPKLRIVLQEAMRRGLSIALKRGRHRWPVFHQDRLLIEGKRCRIFTASRLSNQPTKARYSYIKLRGPKETASEFLLYVLMGEGRDPNHIYVVPRARVGPSTTVSLANDELAPYLDAWHILNAATAGAGSIPEYAIGKRKPKREPVISEYTIGKRKPKPELVRELPWALQEVKTEVDRRRLAIELEESQTTGVSIWQKCVLIQGKRCQILQTKVFGQSPQRSGYVSLNLPKKEWAEYLIYVAKPSHEKQESRFFVVPRKRLPYRTAVAPNTGWLKDCEDGWTVLVRS